MTFNQEEKKSFLKAFTNLLKDANGRGPRNIYIVYMEKEIHVVMQGVVSDFEKYLIRNFGQEAIDTFTDFYERDAFHSERAFLNALDKSYPFKFYKLECDFIHDVFVFKMKIE